MTPAFLFASMWLASAPPSAAPPSRPLCDQPTRTRRWACRQPWPLILQGGARAIGFKPFPSSPVGSVGTELLLCRKGFFRTAVGLELGAFRHRRFNRGGMLDAQLLFRLVAPFGLDADLGLVVGGQLSSVAGRVYRADANGQVRAARAPWTPAARGGLSVGLGYDFGQVTRAPLRLFARYRQLVQTPFMAGNELPAMGLASVTFGLAVEIGTLRRRHR